MVGEAIGGSLPAAMGVALTPFAIIAIAILASDLRGLRNAGFFALGWAIGLAGLALLLVLLFDEVYEGSRQVSTLEAWLRIGVGAALLYVGYRSVRTRIGSEPPTEEPRWLATLGVMSGRKSLVLGVVSSALNPKVMVLSATAVSAIAQTGIDGFRLVSAVAVYVLVGSSAVLALLAIAVIGGERSAALLGSVRSFMIANTDLIIGIVLLLLGMNILGTGLSALGS
jgi:hypothetical protein